ncbi:SDR family oxidoreductase, partial [Flavobacteriaceae bacterium]|nr:SDR family oxidoreductase [Flavobacteriaceae bacterium]
KEGHTLVCCVRDLNRIPEEFLNYENVSFIKVDFLETETLDQIPKDIDFAYYLIHSMSSSSDDFEVLEHSCASNFKNCLETTTCKQVVYLGGIANDTHLSKHLSSRKKVENTLKSNIYALTAFRAGIVVGSGSASFEIIRDLVEKLPLMITPRWLNTQTQPIAVKDIVKYLTRTLGREETYNKSFDIFGPELLNYKQMLLQFSEVRGLKRWIYTLPIMTPKLSSYWLYFMTSTPYRLAMNLVDSMDVAIIGSPSNINELLDIQPMTYKKAVEAAFLKISQNSILSSWKDATISSSFSAEINNHIEVPKYGCFKDLKIGEVTDRKRTLNKIWAIGGKTGWYYGNFLWRIRGFIDRVFGGTGLRRGRTHKNKIQNGDALDFWRVLYANKKEGRLLLYAEMKLPGEAWLEFNIIKGKLYQKATFRPKGLAGRLYWYSVLPFHGFIFKGMLKNILK